MKQPSMGSLLLCHEMPEIGGDNMFANMYQAYDTLSEPLADYDFSVRRHMHRTTVAGDAPK